MKTWIKIALLILVVFPIWLTIVAFAAETTNWREKLNEKLLEIKSKKIQIAELMVKPNELPEELANLKFDLDVSGVRDLGVSQLGIRFYDEKGLFVKAIRISAKLFIQEQVPVASRSLNAGDVVDESDLTWEWRDASQIRGSVPNRQEIAGRSVRMNISSGEVVYESRLVRNVLVNRGDRVRISITSGGLLVSAVGIAQEAGVKGQTIKVINQDSRKEIFATVTDSKAVEVKL